MWLVGTGPFLYCIFKTAFFTAGLQSRQVKCYETDRDSGYSNVAKPVDVHLCELNQMPFGSRRCNSSCPGECVYSEWGTWQPCTSTVDRRDPNTCDGVRKRTRTLLRKSDPDVGKFCEVLGSLRHQFSCGVCDLSRGVTPWNFPEIRNISWNIEKPFHNLILYLPLVLQQDETMLKSLCEAKNFTEKVEPCELNRNCFAYR